MFWTRDGHVRRLVDRYLDPRRSWSGAQDRELRGHLRDCDACRRHYDRAVTLHRLMVGLAPDRQSPLEVRRATVAAVSPHPNPAPRAQSLQWRPVAAFATLALVAAVAAVTTNLAQPEDGSPARGRGTDEYIGARGAAPGRTAEPLVGIGLSGVTEGGREYEVVAEGTAWLSDYLRFFYTCEDRDLRSLFVFGLQEGPVPLWYFPLPEERRSVAIQAGDDARSVALPYETSLASRHRPGPLRIVALFSERPLELAAVQVALEQVAWQDRTGVTSVGRAVARQLGQTQRVVARELTVRVAPGSKGALDDREAP